MSRNVHDLYFEPKYEDFRQRTEKYSCSTILNSVLPGYFEGRNEHIEQLIQNQLFDHEVNCRQRSDSAHPSLGASAIFHAARLIAKIEEIEQNLRQRPYDLFDPPFTTLNIGVIEGGTAKNIVPGHCRFLLEWRPIPGEDTRHVPRMVRQAVELLQRENQELQCEIKIVRDQPGFEAIANSDLVRRIEISGGKKPVALSFGTEATVFSKVTDDVVVFGPGDMRTAHSNRECVPIAELGKCVTCLKELITAT